MTLEGTVNKTGILLLTALLTASYSWSVFATQGAAAAMPLMLIGAIGGLIVAMITIFAHRYAHITAPLYAALEGLFLGAVSAMYNEQYQGLPMQAVILTFAVLIGLLFAYRSGWIKATENFKLGVFAATAGIALFYVIAIVLSFFGIQAPLIHDNGWMGIGFSLVVVGVAALNLVMDFDFIEKAAGVAPKQQEWVGAFGLTVTLVWLYLEILRLLAKLQSRNSR